MSWHNLQVSRAVRQTTQQEYGGGSAMQPLDHRALTGPVWRGRFCLEERLASAVGSIWVALPPAPSLASSSCSVRSWRRSGMAAGVERLSRNSLAGRRAVCQWANHLGQAWMAGSVQTGMFNWDGALPAFLSGASQAGAKLADKMCMQIRERLPYPIYEIFPCAPRGKYRGGNPSTPS